MPYALSIQHKPIERRQEDDFCSVQRLSNFHGDQVGINSKSSPFAVESERRYDGNDLRIQEKLQDLHIDSLYLAGILIIDSMENADRMGDHAVGVSSSEINLRKTLHDLVRQPNCHIDRELKRCFINHPGSIKV